MKAKPGPKGIKREKRKEGEGKDAVSKQLTLRGLTSHPNSDAWFHSDKPN